MCLLGNVFALWGPSVLLFKAIFSSWLHFWATLVAFLVLKNGLGQQGCAKKRPRDERTIWTHLFGHFFCVFSIVFEAVVDKILESVWRFDRMLNRIRRSTAGAHMQPLRACAVTTQLSVFCFFLKTAAKRVASGFQIDYFSLKILIWGEKKGAKKQIGKGARQR